MTSRERLLLSIADELERVATLTEDVGANIAAEIDFTPANLDKLQAIDVAAQTQRLVATLLRDMMTDAPEHCLDRVGMEALRRRLAAGLSPVMIEEAA
ncbi:hypothetical protein [Bradyrhizobium sp.]|uniref:hypothetical protein n=1 Tax=Bradyrhizobium sp. TaxID=376 RepID=UPI0025BF212E|nr:hypothetical protein [Bradyrhizobium sp.]MCA3256387.1 hypothetical protein [Alphaproteobacteria bacterium]MCA3567751.1 hypothetical protein [Bradyrhizobium sp.]